MATGGVGLDTSPTRRDSPRESPPRPPTGGYGRLYGVERGSVAFDTPPASVAPPRMRADDGGWLATRCSDDAPPISERPTSADRHHLTYGPDTPVAL